MNETPQFVAGNYASTAYNPSNLSAWTSPTTFASNQFTQSLQPFMGQNMPVPSRRLVQVFICDPNENVPLDKCLLYSSEQKLTDLNDQELFFEIDIKSILEKHNAVRATLADKKVKERVEYLEPARVRDLKMIVVTVAQF